MKTIPLTQGKYAIVDDEDFEILIKWKWCADRFGNKYYATRNLNMKRDGKKGTIRMHRQILNAKEIDHKDGNGLNNSRSNLRPCTRSQNCMNRSKRKGSKSKYFGIYWEKWAKKWRAEITINGKHKFIGVYKNEKQAAMARDREIIKIGNQFSRLNFPLLNQSPSPQGA